MIYEITTPTNVTPLFANRDEALIWSCSQEIMGKIYANDLNHPTAALTILGNLCFFVGEPNTELVSYKLDWCTQDFIIMAPQNEV
ncbi:MAG: GNAT family N-acetyltransferase [Lachnospiraceae bacterium]|nr:GNAT family N-acetyltransferase [Lachnospiraceae bacterium]